MANVLRYPLAAATCRALARDFRATAIQRQRDGEPRRARACERIARRYDARAARLTYEARGPIIPPASFGAWAQLAAALEPIKAAIDAQLEATAEDPSTADIGEALVTVQRATP